MKRHNLLFLVAATCLLGGCAATLTPTGEIYTEALLPVDTTVIVEREALVAYGPRPVPPRVINHHPRGSVRPGPHHRFHHGPSVRQGVPGQHRAPGVRGPRPSHRGSHGTPGFQGQRPSGQAGRPQAQHGPQGSHTSGQNSHGSHSRGPR